MKDDYYKTKESVEEYIRLAKGIDGANLIDKLKKYISSNAILLEIGSGPGADWEILNKNYEVIGSDNSKEFLNHLSQKHPSNIFIELDAVTLNTIKSFDGIYSNKVMHHLNDDELTSSIKRQYDILHPDGIICHSFWKGEGSEFFNGLYVNYHSESTLKKFFEQYFDILVIEEYAEFEKGDSLLLIAKKGQ